MVFGGTQTERIALSEATAWSGAPATDEVNPGALPHLDEMRQLFFDGKYEEFQLLCNKYLPGHAKNFGTNLPLPELQLAFENAGEISEYRRSLDLDTAIASVRFRSRRRRLHARSSRVASAQCPRHPSHLQQARPPQLPYGLWQEASCPAPLRPHTTR